MIHTFGCSFTKWYWPTWSDWLAIYLNKPVTNWAYPGHTNAVIYNTLLAQCRSIQKNDTVYIMWTGNNRVCQWYDHDWIFEHKCAGFFPGSDLWFSKKAWQGLYKIHPDHQPSLTEMIVNNFDIILRTQWLLESIGIEYYMMFWQNPWLDTREQHYPDYRRDWHNKAHISQQEADQAQTIMQLDPTHNTLYLINWSKFISAPEDTGNPATYHGLWEFLISNKQLVVHGHDSDPHPNTVAHHDWLANLVLNTYPIHRTKAIEIATQSKTMSIPQWNATQAIPGAEQSLNQYKLL